MSYLSFVKFMIYWMIFGIMGMVIMYLNKSLDELHWIIITLFGIYSVSLVYFITRLFAEKKRRKILG